MNYLSNFIGFVRLFIDKDEELNHLLSEVCIQLFKLIYSYSGIQDGLESEKGKYELIEGFLLSWHSDLSRDPSHLEVFRSLKARLLIEFNSDLFKMINKTLL